MENVLRLHIKESSLELKEFQACVVAFADTIQALADESAPMARWMISVEQGSLCINAELESTDEAVDVAPMFSVIEGGVKALTEGRATGVVPDRARAAYRKLTAAVCGRDNSTLAEIVSIGGAHSGMPMAVSLHKEDCDAAATPLKAVGSITGQVYQLNVRGNSNRFGIIDETTGAFVRGTFGDPLLEGFKDAVKRRSLVAGIITYAPDGTLKSLDARSIAPLPTKVPSMSSLRGILEA